MILSMGMALAETPAPVAPLSYPITKVEAMMALQAQQKIQDLSSELDQAKQAFNVLVLSLCQEQNVPAEKCRGVDARNRQILLVPDPTPEPKPEKK